ncbi:hypothetical protein KEM55_006815, partial [Ascosphaera atra]
MAKQYEVDNVGDGGTHLLYEDNNNSRKQVCLPNHDDAQLVPDLRRKLSRHNSLENVRSPKDLNALQKQGRTTSCPPARRLNSIAGATMSPAKHIMAKNDA